MKRLKNKASTKVYIQLTLLVGAIFLILGVLSAWLTYPTENHRNIERQRLQLVEKYKELSDEKLLNNNGYKSIVNTQESTFSSVSAGLTGLVSYVVLLVAIWKVNNYLRQKIASPSNRYIFSSALIVGLSAYFGLWFMSPYFYSWIIQTPLDNEWIYSNLDPIYIIFAISFSFTIAWLFAQEENWSLDYKGHKIEVKNAWAGAAKLYIDTKVCDKTYGIFGGTLRGKINTDNKIEHVEAKVQSKAFHNECIVYIDNKKIFPTN